MHVGGPTRDDAYHMKAVLLMLTLLATASPALAGEPQITCDQVRAYVAKVGIRCRLKPMLVPRG